MLNMKDETTRIRVLHIVGRLGYAGLETVVMNYYRHIDREKVQFDFVVGTKEKEHFDDEIVSLGGKIYRLNSRVKAPFSYIKSLARIIRENKYETIHIHQNSASMIIEAFTAKCCGVRTIIGHSHNSRCDVVWQHYCFKPLVNFFLTNRFACSKEAGQWVFGTRKDVTIINNAINLQEFNFDENVRNAYRKKLKLENNFVIGFIGRFQLQKNPLFLMKVFEEIHKKNKKAVLLLIGDGELQTQMIKYAKENDILSSVRFLGKRDDIAQLLFAMDVFILPSLFEGFGMVTIEAMATGLSCVTSNHVPCPNVLGRKISLPLEEGPEIWADTILQVEILPRNNISDFVRESGYDIAIEAKKLQNFYLNGKE